SSNKTSSARALVCSTPSVNTNLNK
ncbi:unnamed protein product, partial [Rotaria magnacalcarata]